ncbi:Uncharacterised protein [Mycobacteroides abscessus subsp. abscessus]|nr:Uncharacterised protein [Mycobacteroides abscessus subsp. abscessus]
MKGFNPFCFVMANTRRPCVAAASAVNRALRAIMSRSIS